MSDVLLDVQSKPATPGAGQAVFFVDSVAKIPCIVDDSGRVAANSRNAAVASQTPVTGDTYITNSDLIIPSFQMQVGTMFQWRISVSKTAVSTATPDYSIRIGADRAITDTARLVLTGPAQSANSDVAVIEVFVTVRSVGGAGVLQGTVYLDHNLSATGFATLADVVHGTSAGFDNSDLDGLYIGLSINSGGTAVWTVTQVQVEAIW